MGEYEKSIDVVSIGLAVADALGRPIDHFPEKGKLVMFDRMELHLGGLASATAVTLARLGARVSLVARVGLDGMGDFLLNYLDESGVDTSHVVRDSTTATAFTFVAVSSDGDRTFFHAPGADNILSIDDVETDLLRKAKIIHIGGTLVMRTLDGEQTTEILRKAKEGGATTSIDTAYNSEADTKALLKGAYPHIDYFFAGYEEGVLITGKKTHKAIARNIKKQGCGTVIVKLGEKGSYILTENEEYEIDPFPASVVDTCGAGDVYVGGFLFGLSQGWPISKCGRAGSLLSSYSISAVGGTAGVPRIDDLGYLESLI